MTKREFIDIVKKIHFMEDCNISNAIDIARKRNEVTNSEFISWFGKNKNGMQSIDKE